MIDEILMGIVIGGLCFIAGRIMRFNGEPDKPNESDIEYGGQEGITIVIDWLLIRVNKVKRPEKFIKVERSNEEYIKVEMMGTEYPFEPDVYYCDSMIAAMELINRKVIELDVLSI